ncbi:class I SAM-dependent methyltransferase [Helicobacter turcicus]|uniref:class I SAM-dependent methyltransferase n=1 Tax=Helicobacter turcicus TaxID=2867412 RepID=UPI001F23963E|nr:methyltransferase domain-containing protein [Helicobacter turcicus]
MLKTMQRVGGGQFDRVCSFQVLEHVSNPYSFLNAQIKCLKKGGLLFVAVPSEEGFMRYVSNEILNCPPHHVSRYTDKALHKIAEIFQLEFVEIWHEPSNLTKTNWQRMIFEAREFIKNDKLVLRDEKYEGIMKIKCIRRLMHSFNKRWAKFINVKVPNDYGHTVVAVYKKKF